jgi:glycosyltransferase involved in cell wall biosynthesis
MACGTPVIAFNKGAVPEIVVDGKTGFVVDSMNAMIEAVDRIDSINPGECREHVKNHFSIKSMAGKYSELYHQILDSHKTTDTRSRFLTDHPFKPVPHGTRAA